MPPLSIAPNALYRCTVAASLWLIAVGVCSVKVVAQETLPPPIGHTGDPFADDLDVGTFASGPSPGTLDRLHGSLLRRDLGIESAQSCAAASCHGGPRPGVSVSTVRRGAAYQLWKENDPHARSWRTICSDESVSMMRRLRILDGNRIIDRKGFDNCLACHNTTQRYDETRTAVSIREGVGCGACHGPSERWASTHFRWDWSTESAEHDGFVNAGDLYSRARMCASCHVGDKDRDMNHDIIAAGHPTLRYELATYHAWQPKHWRDAEAADKTYYEAQLWLAGQVAAADASLSLLVTRAADAHSVSQWPEFAAYDCASCHHNLGLDNDRSAIDDNRKATAIYSQWNDAGLRWLLDYRITAGAATDEDRELSTALDTVAALMEVTPRPDADAVSVAALDARKKLAAWFDGQAGADERRHFRSDRLGKVVAAAAGDADTYRTWESAAQFYLAAVAARESWPGGWDGPLRDLADRMQRGLRYPEMIDVSRYAKRSTATGPKLTRTDAIDLGITLGGFLGPVHRTAEQIRAADRDRPDDRDLDAKLQQALQRLEQQIKERKPAADVPPPVKPRVEPPPKVEPPKRESIEDIRRALEELQSGQPAATPNDNGTPSMQEG